MRPHKLWYILYTNLHIANKSYHPIRKDLILNINTSCPYFNHLFAKEKLISNKTFKKISNKKVLSLKQKKKTHKFHKTTITDWKLLQGSGKENNKTILFQHFWLTTCLLCAEARALPSSVQLRVAFISSTSSFNIFSFCASCWLLSKTTSTNGHYYCDCSNTVSVFCMFTCA